MNGIDKNVVMLGWVSFLPYGIRDDQSNPVAASSAPGSHFFAGADAFVSGIIREYFSMQSALFYALLGTISMQLLLLVVKIIQKPDKGDR